MAPESDAPAPALGPEFGWEIRTTPLKTRVVVEERLCPQCVTPNWDEGEVCGACSDENAACDAADLANDSRED